MPVQKLHHTLAFSNAYVCEPSTSESSKEILDIGELVALFTYRTHRKFPSLPEEYAYKQSFESESEAGRYRLIDSCEKVIGSMRLGLLVMEAKKVCLLNGSSKYFQF